MLKLLPAVLVAASVLVASTNYASVTLAGTCASKCGPKPIQFTPGQPIRLEVVNKAYNLVKLEKIQGSKPISLQPGEEVKLEEADIIQPNISLVFWDEKGFPLQAVVSKPNFGTLRLEIRPGIRNPGDRSLYILNDGRISVL